MKTVHHHFGELCDTWIASGFGSVLLTLVLQKMLAEFTVIFHPVEMQNQGSQLGLLRTCFQILIVKYMLII